MSSPDPSSTDVEPTPAVRRLTWLLRVLADPRELSADALGDVMAPGLVAGLTPAQFVGSLLQVADALGTPEVERVDSESSYDAAARLVAADGRMWTLRCLVDHQEPHGILHTQLTPARVPTDSGCSAPVPWAELADPAPVGSSSVPAALTAVLDARLDALREELQQPGLVAAVSIAGETVYWRGIGFAEVATHRRPARRTAVRAGAVTAVTTTLAALRLVRTGAVDLDAPVNSHLRTFAVLRPDGAPEVRLVDLLTHTSGLLPQAATVVGVRAGLPVPTPGEQYAPALVADLPRGARVVPADENLTVVGQLIEDVTGSSLGAYVAAEVLDPLGMRHSSYAVDDRVARQPMCGYDVEFGDVLVAAGTDVALPAAAGLVTTVDDLLRLGEALSNRAKLTELYGERGADLLTAAYAPTAVPGVATTAGMFTAEIAGRTVCWRTGGWPGAMTTLWVAPEAGTSVVLSGNAFTPVRLMAFDDAAAGLVATVLENREVPE